MHNLKTVFSFEVTRTLKKKTFWLVAFMMPALIGAIFGVMYFTNQASEKAAEELSKESYSLQILDESNTISPEIMATVNAAPTKSRDAGIDAVRFGDLDAFFYYPSDLSTNQVEVYAKNVGIFENSRYENLANELLKQSATATTSANTQTILAGNTVVASTTYKDGAAFDPFMQMLAPGIFLVLFYFLIATFGNQALSSTIEEKENRVIEMLLTTVRTKTLIVGKILALIVLAMIQMSVLLVPLIIGYIILNISNSSLLSMQFDPAQIPIDPLRILTNFVIFALSFVFFIGLLVALGAAMPTAKEANNFIGVVMIGIFGPLYAAQLFFTSPESPVVQVLTYFPLTAPIPLMLRNAAGTISTPELLIGIAILLVSTVVVINLAVRAFKFGALEYSRKLSLRQLLSKY